MTNEQPLEQVVRAVADDLDWHIDEVYAFTVCDAACHLVYDGTDTNQTMMDG